MARWWRTLAACAESLSLCPGTHLMVHTICNSSSKGSDSLFWPPRVPAMHVAHLLTGKNLICIKSKIFIENKMKRFTKEIHMSVFNFEMLVVCHSWFLHLLKTVMYLCVSMCACTHVCVGSADNLGKLVLSSTMWDPYIKFRSPALETRIFTCWPFWLF